MYLNRRVDVFFFTKELFESENHSEAGWFGKLPGRSECCWKNAGLQAILHSKLNAKDRRAVVAATSQ